MDFFTAAWESSYALGSSFTLNPLPAPCFQYLHALFHKISASELLGWPIAGQGVAGRLGRGAGVWDVVLALGSPQRWLFGQLILHLTTITRGKRATLACLMWAEEPATAFNQVARIIAVMRPEMLQCKQANGDWGCLAWWMSGHRVCSSVSHL